MADEPDIGSLPGFRRRFVVRPEQGRVTVALEDDFHCMSLDIHHDGASATKIEPAMHRAPWTTCPGAIEQLRRTFGGLALSDFPARGDKPANCTHLYDLAMLGAAHACDEEPLLYDILISDPVQGHSHAELRRNGARVLGWSVDGWEIVASAALHGLRIDSLGEWISGLDADLREAARILRWATMVAHGRQIPIKHQSNAAQFPPNCYTFQPENAAKAVRTGVNPRLSRRGC